MNVCIGKPPHEYRRQKDAKSKRLEKVNETQPRGSAKRRNWQVRDKKSGGEGENGDGESQAGSVFYPGSLGQRNRLTIMTSLCSGDNAEDDVSDRESDADGVEIGNGTHGQLSQADIEAFMETVAREATGGLKDALDETPESTQSTTAVMEPMDQTDLSSPPAGPSGKAETDLNGTTSGPMLIDNDAEEAHAVDQLDALGVEHAPHSSQDQPHPEPEPEPEQLQQ